MNTRIARRTAGVLAVTAAIGLGLQARAEDKSKDGGDMNSLAGARKVDEFNALVKDKANGDGKPVRGGSLRLRIPTEPKSLNRIVENGAGARYQTWLQMSRLVERDNATFEWLPQIAWSWTEYDVVLLKPESDDGEPKKLHGQVIKEGKESITFAPNVGIRVFGKHLFRKLDMKAGVGELKDRVYVKSEGRVYVGTATTKDGTVSVAVDMPWFDKETKTFKAEDCEIREGETIKGTMAHGITGDESSHTVRITVKPETTETIALDKIHVEKESIGKRKKSFPAIHRRAMFDFHMRRGVRWHDGALTTADDVIFSVTTIKNPAVDCEPLRNYFRDLTDWEKLDDYTVRLEYGKQYFQAFSICAELALMPKHRYDVAKFEGAPEEFGKAFNVHPDNMKPIYNGPYRFQKWEKGVQVELIRNEDWFAQWAGIPWIDPKSPYLDRITFVKINNKDAALKELRKGGIDADFDIEPLTWRDPENQSPEFKKSIVRARFLQPTYTYIGWNQDREGVSDKAQFFSDKNVRTAMTMLINRESILNDIHGGLGEIVCGPFYRYGPFNNPDVKRIEYNPERAKVLLDRAGWVDHDGDGIRDKDGVKFEFEYVIHNARAYHQKIADKVKESVEQAGVRMNIRKIDWRVFQDTVRDRKFDAVRFAWGEPSCISTDPFQIWHSSSAENRGSNSVSFRNDRADALMEKIRRTLDFKKRQRLMQRLHKLIHSEQPYTFLFNFYSMYFYNNRYRNVKYYVIGEEPYNLLEWYVPKELQRKS